MYDDLMTLLRTSYGWDVEPSAIPHAIKAKADEIVVDRPEKP